MESGKSLNSNSGEKESAKTKPSKNRSVEIKNANHSNSEYESGTKIKNFKKSMIPVVKNEKTEIKTFACKTRSPPSRLSNASKENREKEDFDYKLKVIKEKEKSIAEYYYKIEELIQKYVTQKRDNGRKKFEDSSARKMTSDPSVVSKNRITNEISDFENNIQQISNIWLRTTSDLSSTLKNLKNNSHANPIELQMENIRIQLAIKQAKSLTLVKTRSVIAEAKKLFRNREIIRSELESLLKYENLKNDTINNQRVLEEIGKTFNQKILEEQGMDGTGDSLKDSDASSLENTTGAVSDKHSIKEKLEEEISIKLSEDKFFEKKENNSVQMEMKLSSQIVADMENLKKELIKKNKTITNLNKKIFDLQKSSNENSSKYNQLQNKLFEFHEKIQWNQVLWKQIGKLKERIRSLQQLNRELEYQKKDLECKVIKRDQEIDRLLKLNHILNKKKQMLNVQEITSVECKGGDINQLFGESVQEKYLKKFGNKVCVDEAIISGKQTTINQLKKILNVMKDQENFAQTQISVFQSRIEELEKNGKV